MADQASELEALDGMLSDASAEPTSLSYALIKSITDDFSREIGRGGFGVVYLGALPNGKVAVKKLSISQDFSDRLFRDEVHCLIRAKHNNIVRFLGYCSDTQGTLMEHNGRNVMAEVRQRLLCFEYVPNGNLHHYLKEKPHGDEWKIRYQMIKGICEGLNYLHKERINHLDLKPENVLLDAHMESKITDFGLSRWFDEGQSRIVTKSTPGTRGYIAPEIIDKGEITFKSDIFSLGVIVIKLLTGSDNNDTENWHESIVVDGPQVKSCIEIARTCVEADPHNRPSIGDIIHKLNEMDSIQESRNDQGSSIHQPRRSASEELPPAMSGGKGAEMKRPRQLIDAAAAPTDPNSVKLSLPEDDGGSKLDDSLHDDPRMTMNPMAMPLNVGGGDTKGGDTRDPAIGFGGPMSGMPPPPQATVRPNMIAGAGFPPMGPHVHVAAGGMPAPGFYQSGGGNPVTQLRLEPQMVRMLQQQQMVMMSDSRVGAGYPPTGNVYGRPPVSYPMPPHLLKMPPHLPKMPPHLPKMPFVAATPTEDPVVFNHPEDDSGDDSDTESEFDDEATPPNAGGDGNKLMAQMLQGNSNKADGGQLRNVNGGGVPTSGNMDAMRCAVGVQGMPTVCVSPVPFHQGRGSGTLSGREMLQLAAAAENSISMAQQQHMALMQQQHMAFYLFLFLFLFLFTIIIIIIVIFTFKARR